MTVPTQKKVIIGLRYEQKQLFIQVFDFSEKVLLSLGKNSGKCSDPSSPTSAEKTAFIQSIENVFQACSSSGYKVHKVSYLGPVHTISRRNPRQGEVKQLKSMVELTKIILKVINNESVKIGIKPKFKKAIPKTGVKKGQKVGKDFLNGARYLILTHLKSNLSRGEELAVCAALNLGNSEKSLHDWMEKIEKARAKRQKTKVSQTELTQFKAAITSAL